MVVQLLLGMETPNRRTTNVLFDIFFSQAKWFFVRPPDIPFALNSNASDDGSWSVDRINAEEERKSCLSVIIKQADLGMNKLDDVGR